MPRISAATLLVGIGSAAKDAVPALSEALKDKEARVSSAAERALASINK